MNFDLGALPLARARHPNASLKGPTFGASLHLLPASSPEAGLHGQPIPIQGQAEDRNPQAVPALLRTAQARVFQVRDIQ